MTSLERGLEVLFAATENAPCSVEELSRQVGLPLSTTYRYARILRGLGYLEESEARLNGGPRLLQLSLRSEPNRALAKLADPVMSDLVDATGMSALLSVRVGISALCIHSVEPRRHVRLAFQLPTPQPLYAGASGKPLLAHAPAAVLEEVIAGGLTPFTDATPDAAHLRRQLAMIRATGYCLTTGELDEHAGALGVPVFLGRRTVAALSVAGSVDAFGADRLATVRDQVMQAGLQIRRLLERTGEAAPTVRPAPYPTSRSGSTRVAAQAAATPQAAGCQGPETQVLDALVALASEHPRV